jgi:SulP family sulfate permease
LYNVVCINLGEKRMKIFEPKILTALKGYSAKQVLSDIVAGVIVAIIALPLSIALAIASGATPERGLYTAIFAGFVIALFGGSKVNISGPTAAFATIVAGIVAQFGTSGLVIATLMAGLILILMGVFRFGSLIKYIPHTITTGFTSGIALTIVIGQIKDFLGLTFPEGMPTVETAEKVEAIIHYVVKSELLCLLIIISW